MYKIMVVEDDKKISEIILSNLVKWGFDGVSVDNFEKVFDEFSSVSPHLVLMDVNLPFYDGFYWCNRIRQMSKVPVIFISSRNSSMDIVMAVNMGGDDYIVKPFSLEVLMAKINAVLRRTYSYGESGLDIIEHNGVVLDLKSSSVIYNNQKTELTGNEFKILCILMKSHGSIVSRDSIMRALWEDESFVDDNTLTVNINRLRKKLSDMGLDDFVLTKKNQGYVIL